MSHSGKCKVNLYFRAAEITEANVEKNQEKLLRQSALVSQEGKQNFKC